MIQTCVNNTIRQKCKLFQNNVATKTFHSWAQRHWKTKKDLTVTVCEIERKKRANNSVGAAYKYEFVFQKFWIERIRVGNELTAEVWRIF